MLNLSRNTSVVFYKLFTGSVDVVDEMGYITGDKQPKYSPMRSTRLNILPNRGNAQLDAFGVIRDYDRIAVTSDTKCPINESSILWVDGADTTKTHNCVVVGRAPWKNSIAYALRMVEVSDG